MRFLDRLLIENPKPQLDEAGYFKTTGSGSPGDFSRKHHNYLGYKLQDVGDPILREHMATWLAKILRMRHADNFVKKVMKRDHYSEVPGFQARHYWFFAWALKEIQDQYRWKFTYDWVTKALEAGAGRDDNGNRNFKLDFFREKGTPRGFEDMHKD